jgi:hypothetical protein
MSMPERTEAERAQQPVCQWPTQMRLGSLWQKLSPLHRAGGYLEHSKYAMVKFSRHPLLLFAVTALKGLLRNSGRLALRARWLV